MVAETSGFAGTQRYDAASTIEEAFRRCGKLPSTISAEQLQSARFNLFQQLTNYANRGLGLWCVRDDYIRQRKGRSVYATQSDVVNVLAVQYQRYTPRTAETTTLVGLTITLTFSEPVNPQLLTVTSQVSVDWNAAVEYLDETNTWQRAATLRKGFGTLGLEAEPALSWRVRELTAAASQVTGFELLSIMRETPLSQANRDDYLVQPTKTLESSGESAQFYFRKATPPQLAFTRASDASVGGFRVTVQRQLEDVTALTQLIDCPQRWYGAVVAALAVRLISVIPAEEVPPGREASLRLSQAEEERDAENGETDGAPIRFAVSIRGYTR